MEVEIVIMDLQKLFYEFGEIEFLYNNKHYFVACYNIKKFFNKSKTEYWFINETQKLQKFDDIDSLLDTMVENKMLREILDEIKII